MSLLNSIERTKANDVAVTVAVADSVAVTVDRDKSAMVAETVAVVVAINVTGTDLFDVIVPTYQYTHAEGWKIRNPESGGTNEYTEKECETVRGRR